MATKSIDFSRLTLKDALDLAILIEDEAAERYAELAQQLETHHNADVAGFFRFMLKAEGEHAHRLSERRRSRFGDAESTVTRAMIFDVEAPEYDEVRATMRLRRALEVALAAEEKAYAFFENALESVTDPDVRALFESLSMEEAEHQAFVKREIAKLPAATAETDDEETVAN
ncbi:MAG: ferritin family protein [Polyangiales bacterium]